MRKPRGMTVLELMIVLAIIGAATFLMRSAFRALTKADLVEDATEMAQVMRRASELAIEHGQIYRVAFDLDNKDANKPDYEVEICGGMPTIKRNEKMDKDPEEIKRQIEEGKARLQGLPVEAFTSSDPQEAAKAAAALAGHHVADRTCTAVEEGVTGNVEGKGWVRQLRKGKGIKIKEIWLQHVDDGITHGPAAVYFFPGGSSEKAVVELTDGDAVFSILVYGLTGRVELRDGALDNIDDHMLRDVMGNKDAKREDTE